MCTIEERNERRGEKDEREIKIRERMARKRGERKESTVHM